MTSISCSRIYSLWTRKLPVMASSSLCVEQRISSHTSTGKDMLLKMSRHFPYFTQGKVIKGFGRGSKELGIPTANFPDSVVESLPTDFDCGIYFGWASINSGPVHKMVASIGWNPYYQNTKKTIETHIMHRLDSDFYDSNLKICITGYLRPEKNFASLDDLISAIHDDIRQATEKLESPEHKAIQKNVFFKTNNHL